MSDPIHAPGNSAVPRAVPNESRDRQARESADIDEAAAEFSALLGSDKKLPPGGKRHAGGSPHGRGEDQAADSGGAEGDSSELESASEMPENRNMPSPGDAILQGFSQSRTSHTPVAETSKASTLE